MRNHSLKISKHLLFDSVSPIIKIPFIITSVKLSNQNKVLNQTPFLSFPTAVICLPLVYSVKSELSEVEHRH